MPPSQPASSLRVHRSYLALTQKVDRLSFNMPLAHQH